MMQIKSVALIGAGAVGAYFIAGFTKEKDLSFCLVADGERKERLSREGVIINGETFRPSVRTPEEAANPDLLIIAVKYGALSSILPMVQTVAGPDTIILCPMNGVDCEDILAKKIGWERIIPSFMKISSHRIANSVNYDPDKTPGLYFGEKDGKITERVLAIRDLLANTPVHFHISTDITRDIWDKFSLNIARNLPQAIIGCGARGYVDSEHLAFLCDAMWEEVAVVADAKGIDIRTKNMLSKSSNPDIPNSRFSTLQDIEAKRPTEIDMFSGALMRMAAELGIRVPYNEFAYHAIKALEEKNAGRIS